LTGENDCTIFSLIRTITDNNNQRNKMLTSLIILAITAAIETAIYFLGMSKGLV
jgi:hypothetical protein